jgi:two-component system sensor histidine kinase YesM
MGKSLVRALSGRLVSRTERSSIRYTVFLSFTISAVAAMVLTGMLFYFNFSRQLEQTIQSENEMLVKQVNQSVDTYLRDMLRLSNSIYYNVIKNVDIDSDPINSELQLLYGTYSSYVENIALYDLDGNLLATAPPALSKPGVDVRQSQWFQKALNRTENLHFATPEIQNLFVNAEHRYIRVISLSSAVEITSGKSTMGGVLLIDLKYNSLTELFDHMSLANGGYLYLMDANGELIYHPEQQLIASGLAKENNLVAATYDDGGHQETFNGEPRSIIVRTVGYTGWRIVGVIPQQGIVLNQLDNVLIIIAIFLMLFDIVILINSFISTKLTAPIKHLEESVQTLEYGDADKAIYQGGSYEIRHLGASIQGMVDQLQQLTNDIVREHEQKQKSELDALQSQINPHFLYNALDIIVWMIEREQPREAVNIVTALARLFRISLSRGKNIIPVRDELEHVQNYLTIQTMRYKNKFSYVIEMDDEVKDLAIIKLVVQPLVENAIYHGMDFMDGDGMITISAKIVGDELHLTVADNGLGMKPEVVERLLVENTPVSKGSGVGLKNVNERIKLYFGDRYGVLIKSEPDEGTCITLVLPIIRYETEEASNVGQK